MQHLLENERMSELIGLISKDTDQGIAQLVRCIDEYPNDPRLYFLQGSTLIGAGKHIEAHAALSKAVQLAPDFAIARFQLGFFQLTSGEAEAALETWAPFDSTLDGNHYLMSFVKGLRCLIADDFTGTIHHLREGMSSNEENTPLNKDMQLIIDECTKALKSASTDQAQSEEETSATSFMLNQGAFKKSQY